MASVKVYCPRELEDGYLCGEEIEIECSVVPGEWYGMDADGTRGIWRVEYLEVGDIPTRCSQGHVFTEVELERLRRDAQDAVMDWEPPTEDEFYPY